MEFLNVIGLVVYFLIMLAIGLMAVKHVKNMDDFAIARGIIPWPIVFATMVATFLGGGATLGMGAMGSSVGYVFLFVVFGFAIQFILAGIFIAPTLKQYNGAYTVADIMGFHYGRTTRLLSGFISLLYCIGMLGAMVLGMGVVLQVFLDIPLAYGVIIGIGVAIIYSVAGGLFAVIHTDIIQFITLGLFLPLALLIALFARIPAEGGLAVVLETLPATHFTFLGVFPWTTFLSLFLAFLLGEALAPIYVPRIFAAKAPKHARNGMLASAGFMLIFMFCTTSLGVFAHVLLPDVAGDAVLPSMLIHLLPVGIVGAVIAAVLAALMSTADSTLSAAGVILVQDIYKPLVNKEIGQSTQLLLARIIVLISGVAATVFALWAPGVVEALVIVYSWWASAILVPLILGILWGKGTSYAGFFAMLGGIAAFSIWEYVLQGPYGFTAIVPGIVVSLIVYFIVNGLTSKTAVSPAFTPENYITKG